ncbi:MAG: hypothetical protein ACTSRP_16910 [Candidatus Helarchaeota archaeon]
MKNKIIKFFNNKKKYIKILMPFLINLLFCYYFFGYICDDALISFRYGENFANGYGLTFNIMDNPPIEAYSNFLWVILSSLWFKLNFCFNLNIDPIFMMKILGIIFSSISLVIIYYLSPIFSKSHKKSTIPMYLLVITPNFSIWTVAGLETPLFILGLLISFYYPAKWLKSQKINLKGSLITIFGFLLVAFSRIEGVIYFIIFIFFMFLLLLKDFNKNFLKHFVFWLLTFGIIYGIYFIFRLTYYKNFFPNSFTNKVSAYNTDFIFTIFNLFHTLISDFIVFLSTIPIITIFLFYKIIKIKRISKFALYICIFFLVIIFIGLLVNDWMPAYRFYLPLLPFCYLIISEDIKKIFLKIKVKSNHFYFNLKRIKFSFICSTILILSNIVMIYSYTSILGFSAQYFKDEGEWFYKYTSQNSVIAISDVGGAIPYYSKREIIDYGYGLLSNISYASIQDRVDYVLSRMPEFIYAFNWKWDIELKKDPRFLGNYTEIYNADGQIFVRNDVILPPEAYIDLPHPRSKTSLNNLINEFIIDIYSYFFKIQNTESDSILRLKGLFFLYIGSLSLVYIILDFIIQVFHKIFIRIKMKLKYFRKLVN